MNITANLTLEQLSNQSHDCVKLQLEPIATGGVIDQLCASIVASTVVPIKPTLLDEETDTPRVEWSAIQEVFIEGRKVGETALPKSLTQSEVMEKTQEMKILLKNFAADLAAMWPPSGDQEAFMREKFQSIGVVYSQEETLSFTRALMIAKKILMHQTLELDNGTLTQILEGIENTAREHFSYEHPGEVFEQNDSHQIAMLQFSQTEATTILHGSARSCYYLNKAYATLVREYIGELRARLDSITLRESA